MASACNDADGLQGTLSNPGSSEKKAQGEASGDAVLAHTPLRVSEVVYSAFSKAQKRYIVFCTSWAGFFSPVSSQIYYPALNTLAHDLNVSGGLINLTLMSYMVRVSLSLLSVHG